AARMNQKVRVLDPLGNPLVGEKLADVVTGEEEGEVFRRDIGVDSHCKISSIVAANPARTLPSSPRAQTPRRRYLDRRPKHVVEHDLVRRPVPLFRIMRERTAARRQAALSGGSSARYDCRNCPDKTADQRGADA